MMSKLLLDTHMFLWLQYDRSKISSSQWKVIESAELFVSIVSLWEIAIKQNIGKLKYLQSVSEMLQTTNIELLPLELAHIESYRNADLATKDPFDRLLFTQAKVERMVFLSADSKIRS
jgi:PIN domain nuclease of toxin-antitoxin system